MTVAETCPDHVDDYRSWIPDRPRLTGDVAPVDRSAVHEIRPELMADAIATLADKDVVELSRPQAEQMIGDAPGEQSQETRPFLVRNVVPSLPGWMKSGLGRVDRIGPGLHISVAIIGCGGFRKTPLIVFLPVAPERVEIDAMAAL